jgi:CheY-like chemotaxis protein
MGSTIEVQSRVGQGASFWFEASFPLAEAPVGDAPTGSVEITPAAGAGDAVGRRPLRILAAEDNPTNQLILRAVLQNLGVELQLVANGVEAVGAFREQSFDVVLMDVQMPLMNGVEAARAIRRFEATSGRPRTPIIALSADVMTDHVAEYREAGMDAYLEKPIEIDRLYGLLGKASARTLAEAQHR